jgi:DNA-directed RNA polymerase subunit RPC12/RpoP
MKIRCTQCGAEISIEEDAGFIQCEYCGTHLFVELDRTVRHYSIQSNLGEKSVAPAISRHLSRMELNLPVEIINSELSYFPFWNFTTDQGRRVAIPAATSSIESLGQVTIPAGDLRFFDPGKIPASQIIPPETLLESALSQFKGLGLKDDVKESSLIHVPMFLVTYRYQDMEYEAAVEAVTGNVYSDEYPPLPVHEKDRFFGMMMAVTLALFILEGVIIKGFWLTLLAYAITSIPLYFGIRFLLKGKGW